MNYEQLLTSAQSYVLAQARVLYNKYAVLDFWNSLEELPMNARIACLSGFTSTLYEQVVPEPFLDLVVLTPEFDKVMAELSGEPYEEGCGRRILEENKPIVYSPKSPEEFKEMLEKLRPKEKVEAETK